MRLIDADSVKRRLYDSGTKLDRQNGDPHFIYGIEAAIEVIDSEPSRVAHWKYDKNVLDHNIGAFVCSKCGAINYGLPLYEKSEDHIYEFSSSHYCSCCGAEMRKEDEINEAN